MNRFFTLLLAASCFTAVGQQDSWEYPFPYNPDGNQDGFIGLNDMLDLLSLYGSEFPGSFYGDSTGAILNLGKITFSECLKTARLMGNSWRGLRPQDFHRWLDEILQQGLDEFESVGNTISYEGWVHMSDNDPGKFVVRYDSDYSSNVNGNDLPIHTSWSYIESQDYSGGDYYGNHFHFHSQRQCFVVTEVRPEIEYEIIIRNGIADLKSAVRDSIQNGWNLQGGAVTNWSGNTSQTIWRFKDAE